MAATVVTETPRLILRNWRKEDVEPFLAHTNPPAVMRHLGGPADPDVARTRIRDRTMLWQAEFGCTFHQPGAERVVALTVEENAPSWGLMERLGMTRRPDLDHISAFWAEGPLIVYVIGREEWTARSS